VAVLRGQTVVHRKQSDWSCGRQNPKSVDKIELEWSKESYPELGKDKQDGRVVDYEEEAEEGEVAQVSSICK